MENSFFRQAYKQKLDISSIEKNNLEKTKFSLLNNFVFYFNCNPDKNEVDLYIENHFEALEKLFQSVRKTFIIVNNQNISDSEIQILQYYFPALQVDSNYYNASQSLLDYFNYFGTLKAGLILHNSISGYSPELNITELNQNLTSNQLDLFFKDYFNHIQSNNGYLFEKVPYEKEHLYFQPIGLIDDDEDEIEFDDDSKKEIQLIIDKLNQIRGKGNFIALLPILEEYLQNQEQKKTKISRLHIDQDYKIWLVDYNLEVKLSHLTKTIYFLFLVMEHKIHLSELWRYKKLLTNIYFTVSNQENLDKMRQSIDFLIRDKNAIYVHLSRIKSAFHKLVYKDIAEKYCIQGAKQEPKGIRFDRNLTNITTYRKLWFPEKPMTLEDMGNENDALNL